MPVVKTLVVDMSAHNGNKQYPERYPTGAVFTNGIPTLGDIEEFLQDLDCVFVAEAPYSYWLYERARQLGVKVAVAYNYEFFDWFKYPHLSKPDMLIAPSRWHYYDVQRWCEQHNIKHQYLHWPVDRDKLPLRPITKAHTFLHVVGRAAAHDRNGTLTVIEAAKHVKSDAVIKMHFQGEQGIGHQVTHKLGDYQQAVESAQAAGARIEISVSDYDDYQDVYREGDVLLLPRRYGGNCLPMNEALSCGMPVVMTNVSPNNSFLDTTWLVDAQLEATFEPRTVIGIFSARPEDLAYKIDEFAAMSESQMQAHSAIADGLAQSIDWKVMRKQYVDTLEALCSR
jgi:glycosyltransferase involved in cell wall biosynthesis